jgi:hypothetical protein
MQQHISKVLDLARPKKTGRRLRYFSSQFKCVRVCHFGLEALVAA